MKKKQEKKKEFSKVLLVQESVLIWIMTLVLIALSFICIFKQAYAELPWLTAMVSLPWAAYGVSQTYYYKKAAKENTAGGIKYETVMAELENDEEEEEAIDEEEAEG